MTLDNVACQDPRYLAGLIHTLVLSEVFSLTEGKNQDPMEFQKKVNAFEECYRNDFKGKTGTVWKVTYDFSGDKLWSAVLRAVEVGGTVFLPFGSFIRAARIAASVTGITAGLSAIVSLDGSTSCEAFIENGYKKLANQVAERCEAILGGKYKKDVIVKAVLACITSPETLLSGEFAGPFRMSAGNCVLLKRKTLDTIEYVKQEMDRLMNIGRSGWWGSLKDDAARAVSDAKAWWFSTTYMDFPLKFDLLAKGQGIVLALLTGMFPFVAVLSVIPTGRSFMNWSLLLSFMIAYFMVKMWIPLLFFIVNVAAHKLGAFAVGG
jgi:hypothetical protein